MFKGRRAICKLVGAYSETTPYCTTRLCFFFPLFFLLEKKPRSFPLAMEQKGSFRWRGKEITRPTMGEKEPRSFPLAMEQKGSFRWR
ncbi:PREDICTED: uncharacterized protein LOC107337430 isoform X9 [Acropora digitifera]|uniref:uncharacterized protein LOC107337430 isoform X9 n=1 Tax=Acropora digitifera TaxID=70779 RepID=UPI00077A056E|nr:PREDICTED: uncharacterized protein LOC107337430 isoform X9 [Acropora digitifera]